MPKKVWIKSTNGRYIEVREGSILTKPAFQQWYGWSTPSGYHRDGLRVLWPKAIRDVDWMASHIDQMIADGTTYDASGTEKVIDEYEEEAFYEELESLRDDLNDLLNEAAKRRPLQRRIELIQQTIDHPRTEPELRDAARNRLEALKGRLEAGER